MRLKYEFIITNLHHPSASFSNACMKLNEEKNVGLNKLLLYLGITRYTSWTALMHGLGKHKSVNLH